MQYDIYFPGLAEPDGYLGYSDSIHFAGFFIIDVILIAFMYDIVYMSQKEEQFVPEMKCLVLRKANAVWPVIFVLFIVAVFLYNSPWMAVSICFLLLVHLNDTLFGVRTTLRRMEKHYQYGVVGRVICKDDNRFNTHVTYRSPTTERKYITILTLQVFFDVSTLIVLLSSA